MEQHDATGGQQPLPMWQKSGLPGMAGKLGMPAIPPAAVQPMAAPHAGVRPMISPIEAHRMLVGKPMWRPETALPAAAPISPQFFSHLWQILQTIESYLPVDQVLHSYHVQATLDPAVAALPAMQRFDAVADTNLHAKIALAGFIRRILQGDRSPEVMLGLQEQVKVLQKTQGEMRIAIAQLMAAEAGKVSPAIQALSQIMPMADQVYQSLMPMLQPLAAIKVRPAVERAAAAE